MEFFSSYFGRENLASVLRKAQFVPGRLAEVFGNPRGATSTNIDIEELSLETVSEGSAIPRGAPATQLELGVRKVHPFQTSTYAWQARVLADEVLNVRAAGSLAPEIIQTRIAEKTAKLVQQASFQHEYLRMACLNTPTNTIGSAPASAAVAFGTSDTTIRSSIHTNVVLAMESALGGVPYMGLLALCSETFWAGLIESKTIKETYQNWTAAAELRGDTRMGFSFGGVFWERYRASGNIAIASGKAKVIPLGVPDLFQAHFAPNDTVDSVGAGAMGAPWYLTSKAIDEDGGLQGYRLTLKTHPLFVCSRPTAILTLGLS